MTESLSRQGLLLLAAGGLGVALGMLYGLGRALRRQRPGLTAVVDGLFAGIFFLVLCALSLYGGGLRIYELLGMALGAAAFALTLGGRWFRLWQEFFRILGTCCRHIRQLMKKNTKNLQKHVKKLFSSVGKWVKINEVSCHSRQKRSRAP